MSILDYRKPIAVCADTKEGIVLFLEEFFAVFIQLLCDAMLFEELVS